MDCLTPFMGLPSRVALAGAGGFSYYDHVYLPESVKDLTWAHEGRCYRSQIVIRLNGEPVEHVGEILVVLDDEGRDACRVRVVEVRECAFSEITWEMAAREGEGDADLDAWRAGHLRFWTGEGFDITPDTQVAWIAFDLA